MKQKEYNAIKDINKSFEKTIKNYDEKYYGFINYFEECLKMFSLDDEIKKNKDLFINLDSLKKGDFNSLNKEEKYSVLVILMKYLMPLIHNMDSLNKIHSLNNVNLNFYLMSLNNKKKNNFKSIDNNTDKSDKNNKQKNITINNGIKNNNYFDKYMKKRIIKNYSNALTPTNFKYNSFDDLPNIENQKTALSPRKIIFKIKNKK